MTFFSQALVSESGDGAGGRRSSRRRDRTVRPRALADFVEDIGILLRYATGRDYYDRRSIASKP